LSKTRLFIFIWLQLKCINFRKFAAGNFRTHNPITYGETDATKIHPPKSLSWRYVGGKWWSLLCTGSTNVGRHSHSGGPVQNRCLQMPTQVVKVQSSFDVCRFVGLGDCVGSWRKKHVRAETVMSKVNEKPGGPASKQASRHRPDCI